MKDTLSSLTEQKDRFAPLVFLGQIWCKNWKYKLRRKSGAIMSHLPPNLPRAVSKLDLIYFKTTVSILRLYSLCHSTSNSVSIPVSVNQALLLNSFLKISIYIFFFVLEVKCAWYLHSLPVHLLISLFRVICFQLPITRTFSIFLEGLSYRETTVRNLHFLHHICPEKICCKFSFSLIHSTSIQLLTLSEWNLPSGYFQ